MKRDQRRVSLLDGLLQVEPETRKLFRERRVGLRPGVPELRAESAQIVALAPVPMIEARHVDVLAADAVVILCRGPHQLRDKTEHVEAHLLA